MESELRSAACVAAALIAVHVVCSAPAFTRACARLQYWWHNKSQEGNPYTSFDDFLMHLRQSKRKNIRQVGALLSRCPAESRTQGNCCVMMFGCGIFARAQAAWHQLIQGLPQSGRPRCTRLLAAC